MDKIKDVLWSFLGYDGEIEWDLDKTVISGTNDTIFVTIRTPSSTPNEKWWVSVYPKVCIDAGLDVDAVGTEEDTDVEVCNWFQDYELFIHEKLLENLTAGFKEIHSILEDIHEMGRDLDLCD